MFRNIPFPLHKQFSYVLGFLYSLLWHNQGLRKYCFAVQRRSLGLWESAEVNGARMALDRNLFLVLLLEIFPGEGAYKHSVCSCPLSPAPSAVPRPGSSWSVEGWGAAKQSPLSVPQTGVSQSGERLGSFGGFSSHLLDQSGRGLE